MPTTYRVITLNDDFTTPRKSDVRATLEDRRPLAVLAQEAKTHHYADLLPGRYAAGQDTASDATAGVAVLWLEEQFTPTSDVHHQVLCPPRGMPMLPRGVTWVEGTLACGTTVILASTHRPKKGRTPAERRRYKQLRAEFDRNLRRWVDAQEHPVILGIDANTRRRGKYAKKLGMRQAGRGIDAVLVTPPLRVRKGRRLRKRSSDHHAVEVRVEVP